MGILYNPSFINFSTVIFLISMGAFLRKRELFTEKNLDFLTQLCLEILLPCFILVSFMTDFDKTSVQSGTSILIWSFFIISLNHGISFLLFKYWNLPVKNDKILLRAMLPAGNVTFIGLAINSLVYGAEGAFVTNLYSIATRTFIYTISYMMISGMALTKNNFFKLFKTPALVASLYGLFVFFFQEQTPQITIDGISASIFRIDHSLPFLYEGIKKLSLGLTGLLWLMIGAFLNKESFITAFRSPLLLKFSGIKLVILPILGISLYYLLAHYQLIFIAKEYLAPTLILLTVPVANVTTIFAIKYDRSKDLALSTLIGTMVFSLILLPFYYLFFKYIG